nr:MAG: major capsid protein [Microvirus sp.]
MATNFRNKSANVSRFSMVPRADVPRSVFSAEQMHKTTFDAGWLVPIYLDEILPGDSVNLKMTAFVRLGPTVFPIMDNLHLDTFFFFVPNRLVWDNWRKFMGETQDNDYIVPTRTMDLDGYTVGSIYDYMGLPVAGQIQAGGVQNFNHNVLPLRGYNLIWNEWFRDQELQAELPVVKTDLDGGTEYFLQKRGKRHDYFTSARPWPMRDTDYTSGDFGMGIERFAVRGGAPVSGLGALNSTATYTNQPAFESGGDVPTYGAAKLLNESGAANGVLMKLDEAGFPDIRVQINDLRQAFAVQRLLERDARGGTRYTEIVRSHFGVQSPDARLQRPEYLGGGSSPITVAPVAVTANDEYSQTSRPVGDLGGVVTGVATNHGCSGSFTEHGFLIGLASVRADLTYQQGVNRMWNRETRFDYYWPAFANLGEQPIYRREIYVTGDPSNDEVVFGYAERWAEYRHKPSRMSGRFRSTSSGTLDPWHLAQRFTAAPVLGSGFIAENPPLDRVMAVSDGYNANQVLMDAMFSVRMVRPIPAWSVPGLSDHF